VKAYKVALRDSTKIGEMTKAQEEENQRINARINARLR